MVDNFNYALKFATGDYVCYLTDKMFLLPYSLQKVFNIIKNNKIDIFNWIDNIYSPKSYENYFGSAYYIMRSSDVKSELEYEFYNPQNELCSKAIGNVSRNEQTPSQYARGKIIFGGLVNF